ncbi:hypothetical protein FJTKL_07955 [Diaporthe vaccinii]|uniref:Uncharacterized protein n=1 Tax=Diaporthe vaccinii TaxID=105482 RepID=A0ABR4FDY8_9PEZI
MVLGVVGESARRHDVFQIIQIGVQLEYDPLEVLALMLKLHESSARSRRWRLRRRKLHDAVSPAVVHLLGDVQVPVDREKECHLVLVDLVGSETGNLTPGASRVVPVLQVFRGQDQSREKHSAATLKSATGMAVILKCDLQSRIACPRTAQGLLNKGPQRQDARVASLFAAYHRRRWPDGLDDLSGRI